MMNFLRDITKSEEEFKVFMVYIEYSIHVYNTYIKDVYSEIKNGEDSLFATIAYVKKTYNANNQVLKPFINSVTENEDQVIEKFNIVKSVYEFKSDTLSKLEDVNNAMDYLEKSKTLEAEAKRYSDMAIEILSNLKGSFRRTIYSKSWFR
jgi:hypothetical protein